MKKILLAGVAAAAICGTSALAADMPTKAALMAPVFDWSGFYAGVNGGYAFGDDVGPIAFTNSALRTFTSTGSTFDAEGGFGGVQAGYNRQIGAIVLGVEADIQAAAIKSDISGGVTAFADTYSGNRTLNYFGTVRGRIGYAFGCTLLYTTGGFAYGGLKQNIFSPNAGWSVSQSNIATGFAIGGGMEYALSPVWSVKAEYQYIDLGRTSLSGAYPFGGLTLLTNNLSDHFSTVRVGLNYKFGGDKSTVFATY